MITWTTPLSTSDNDSHAGSDAGGTAVDRSSPTIVLIPFAIYWSIFTPLFISAVIWVVVSWVKRRREKAKERKGCDPAPCTGNGPARNNGVDPAQALENVINGREGSLQA
jgi:hypothetical protein